MVTTMMTNIAKDHRYLTGEERYRIVGDAVTEEEVAKVLEACKALNRHWDCIPKAKMARRILGRGRIAVGALLVWSEDYTSNYGYYFNPPFELHAWLVLEDGSIFDVALPGVIEKGLTTCDEIGPAVIGRDCVVLAGKPKRWMDYRFAYWLDDENA